MLALKEVTKPRSVRDLGPVDIARLVATVKSVPEAIWEHQDEVKDNAYPCFHHTRHIVFRFVERQEDARDFSSKPLWALWRPVLQPVMDQAVAAYGFREPTFSKAMLARLVVGGEIDRHSDGAGTNLVSHKIHVPLITNPRAMLEAGGEVVHLEAGRAYEVNNVGIHAAYNHGDADRIHLIFEVFDAAESAD